MSELGNKAEIDKLQNGLKIIRQAGGWSTAEFGELVGVTSQTIRNIESGKTSLTKTQYIAMRSVLDYEIKEHPENEELAMSVNILLDESPLSDEDRSKATAFLSGAIQSNLKGKIIAEGLGLLLGATASMLVGLQNGGWMARILKKQQKE